MPDKSGLSGSYARAPQTLLFPILKEKDNSALASSPVRDRGCPIVRGNTRTVWRCSHSLKLPMSWFAQSTRNTNQTRFSESCLHSLNRLCVQIRHVVDTIRTCVQIRHVVDTIRFSLFKQPPCGPRAVRLGSTVDVLKRAFYSGYPAVQKSHSTRPWWR